MSVAKSSEMPPGTVYVNCSQIITMKGVEEKKGRKVQKGDLAIVDHGVGNSAVVINAQGLCEYLGAIDHLPKKFKGYHHVDAHQGFISPEVIDSHTHLVFGGDRSSEYLERMSGVSYEAIAARGGGILNTVMATRGQKEEELYEQGAKRLRQLDHWGIGTVEIKSGYGLSADSEKKILRVITKLKKDFSHIRIFSTFMAAHACPPEYPSSDAYVEKLVLPLLEECLREFPIDFVDIFHEGGYFEERHVRAQAAVAKKYNVKLKTHADEFVDNDGARLAAELGAVSADHLMKVGPQGIKALSQSTTIATLLPGTSLFLSKPLAPARELLDHGVAVAMASDFNPGSCHWMNLLDIAKKCGKILNMRPEEIWTAITYNAAQALGIKGHVLVEGQLARVRVYPYPNLDQFFYHWS